MNIFDLVKSNVNSLTGLFKSKKYAVAVIYIFACILITSESKNSAIACAAIASGAFVAAAYVLGQSIIESIAAKTVGFVEDDEVTEEKK